MTIRRRSLHLLDWWADRGLAVKGLIVVSVPAVALIASAFLAMSSFLESQAAREVVTRTLETKAALNSALVLFVDAETSVRGYLITGNRVWLEPYERARERYPAQLADLERRLSSDAERQGLERLRHLAHRRLAVLAATIPYEYPNRPPETMLAESKGLMDALRAELTELLRSEDALLASRLAQVKRLEEQTLTTIAGATIGGVAIGIGTSLLLAFGLARQVRQVHANADRLLRGQPLVPTPPRRDEVGYLAQRLTEVGTILEARMREVQDAHAEVDRFFSLSLDMLCIASTDGYLRRVNPAWHVVLGWAPEELSAVPYLDFVHPDDRAATIAEGTRLAVGEATLSFENRYRCKDGSYRWLQWKAASLPERGLLYAAARDVTHERRAAGQLREQAAAVAAANHELEAFSYSVSHDLRAPLRSIDGFSQALLEDCHDHLGPDGQSHLQRIRTATQHMAQLIDDLLNLARVARTEMRRDVVDLSEMALSVLQQLAATDPARSVAWRVQPELTVRGDARLLRVALTNLLGNAWKFTSKCARAEIEFGANDTSPGRSYFIRDNGAGFDMAYAAKLFGTFQRLHSPREFPGTGVGLATVQRIIRRHGGHISATGAVGRGAEFSFTLPVEHAA